MNQNLDELVLELEAVPTYTALFNQAYPGEKISAINIASALATFERSLNHRDSPYDRWQKGDDHAISSAAKLGNSTMHTWEANCFSCHRGNDFNDDGLWDVGVFSVEAGAGGKFIFKTPTLRDVAIRAPFMHNGSLKSLEDVVRFYARGGDVLRPTRAPPMREKIDLSEKEIYQVVEFLKTLTTDNSDFKRPEIP
jgi:cytochrome c peroxidase